MRAVSVPSRIYAFLFAKMLVKGKRRRPDWHLNQMKAQFGQSSDFAKRFLQISRIRVQRMPVILTGHFGNFGSCDKLFSCPDPVPSWKSPDQFNMSRGFYSAAGSQPALPLDNQPHPIGSHALHCAVLNNIVWHKKLALCQRL